MSSGVALYIKNQWTANFSEISVEEGNCILGEVAGHFSVVAAYIPPSFTNPENFIRSLDHNLKAVSPRPCLVLAGDLNINIIGSAGDSGCSSEYLDIMADYDLVPGINKPTCGKSCIDHIFVPARRIVESAV